MKPHDRHAARQVSLTPNEMRLIHEQLSWRITELQGVLQEALANGDQSHADSLMKTIPELKAIAEKML